MGFLPSLPGWKKYRSALNHSSQKIFDEMMTIARHNADAASCSSRILISENIFMSILLDQQKKINKFQKQLEKLNKIINSSE